MRRVILESPYAGKSNWLIVAFFQRILNRRYARACVRDSLMRGEAPLASHLLYTQRGILNDALPNERHLGIEAGLAWRDHADATVVYVDRGISRGMRYGINSAKQRQVPVDYRQIYFADYLSDEQ